MGEDRSGMGTNPGWTGPDCSLKTCPRAVSFVENDGTYGHEANVECSHRGDCDRSTGECLCFEGYTGSSCQYADCAGDSSDNGICQSNKQFALDATWARQAEHDGAFQTAANADFGYTVTSADWTIKSDEDSQFAIPLTVSYSGAWDSDKQFGMKCDVGFRRGKCNYATGVCECHNDFSGRDCSTISALL